MNARTASLKISLCILAGSLTGCGSMLTSDKPATTTWWLEPLAGAAAETAEAPELSFTLDVVPGLDTERILNINDEAQLNHYAGARWPDNLPDVLHSVMRRSLASSGHFSAVSTHGAGQPGACSLAVEVQEFFAELNAGGGTRSVRMGLEGTIDCGSTSRAFRVWESSRVDGQSMRGIVAAFQQAINSSTQALIAELAEK